MITLKLETLTVLILRNQLEADLLELFVRKVGVPEVLHVDIGESSSGVTKGLHSLLAGHEPT